MTRAHPSLIGNRFGRLVVISESPRPLSVKRKRRYWLCQCDCGQEHVAFTTLLVSGGVRSCGCLGQDNRRQNCNKGRGANATHRMSTHLMYKRWRSLRNRCEQKNNPAYRWYGAKGIVVCERWKSFENFYADMGDPPTPAHQIDRINNNGNYEPNNCRWVTALENMHNTRANVIVEVNGMKMCWSEACRKINVSQTSAARKKRKSLWSHQTTIDYFAKLKEI